MFWPDDATVVHGQRRLGKAALFFAGIVLLGVSLAACGGRGKPSAEYLASRLPQILESPHFTFHFSPGNTVDALHEEAFYAWVVEQLGVEPGQKIQYYRYKDRAEMQSVTGQATNGWADPPNSAVHVIFSWDNHEVTHVLTYAIGRPSDFFNEGIAVALSVNPYDEHPTPIWWSQPVDNFPRAQLKNSTLPRLEDVVETDSFRKVNDGDGYPMAGSFVHFVVSRYGMEKTKEFFRVSNRNDSRTTILANFQQVFGESLTVAEQAWWAYLNQ